MLVFKRIIQDPRELKVFLAPETVGQEVFLPGVTDLEVGEEVCVWFKLPRFNAEIFLTGMVVWRRKHASKRAKGLAAGAGLAMRPGQMSELAFLERVINGEVALLPERRFPRTPVLQPWSCKIIVPDIKMWSPATMNDISPGGARIHADVMPIHEGAAVELGLPWHSGTTHNMELAWFRIAAGKVRLGLKRLPKGEIHEREWQALVERALKFFEEHLKT